MLRQGQSSGVTFFVNENGSQASQHSKDENERLRIQLQKTWFENKRLIIRIAGKPNPQENSLKIIISNNDLNYLFAAEEIKDKLFKCTITQVLDIQTHMNEKQPAYVISFYTLNSSELERKFHDLTTNTRVSLSELASRNAHHAIISIVLDVLSSCNFASLAVKSKPSSWFLKEKRSPAHEANEFALNESGYQEPIVKPSNENAINSSAKLIAILTNAKQEELKKNPMTSGLMVDGEVAVATNEPKKSSCIII